MKISKSVLEARAARRESKSAEEGRRSVQRRERRMGAKRGGDAVGAEREEDGENLKLGAGGEEGVETGGGGEAVGGEEREEEVGENLSKSVLAAMRESEPADEGRRSVQSGKVGRKCRDCIELEGQPVSSMGIIFESNLFHIPDRIKLWKREDKATRGCGWEVIVEEAARGPTGQDP
ncbi:hypothetical protein Scep_002072 [Stephania cephalantha]|uniref:Uncharacterized protein n=1 Tax=Stephania cephalantha TaxID=152367 RepID=A0AAP0L9F6_9MAGN